MILYNSIGEVKAAYSASYLTCPAILRNHVQGTTEYVYIPVWYDQRRDVVYSADNQEISYEYWSVCETDGTIEGNWVYSKISEEKEGL